MQWTNSEMLHAAVVCAIDPQFVRTIRSGNIMLLLATRTEEFTIALLSFS